MSGAEERTRSPRQIEADIEATRKQLADTVEALAEKTDVKAQAKAKAEAASTKSGGTTGPCSTRSPGPGLGLGTVLLKRRS